jgi:hypothetical protein
LLIAMCTNLVLLPSILLSIDKRISRKTMLEEPIIDMQPDSAETIPDNVRVP